MPPSSQSERSTFQGNRSDSSVVKPGSSRVLVTDDGSHTRRHGRLISCPPQSHALSWTSSSTTSGHRNRGRRRVTGQQGLRFPLQRDLPQKYLEKDPNCFKANAIGSGPFKLKAFTRGSMFEGKREKASGNKIEPRITSFAPERRDRGRLWSRRQQRHQEGRPGRCARLDGPIRPNRARLRRVQPGRVGGLPPVRMELSARDPSHRQDADRAGAAVSVLLARTRHRTVCGDLPATLAP